MINVTAIWMLQKKIQQTNAGALVRQRTIPTERPPLVGEVSANFCKKKVHAYVIIRKSIDCLQDYSEVF
jgi:hypothetical protein